MSRRRSDYPSYRLHKQSGQAVVTLTDPSGQRRGVLLGEHNTPESQPVFVRWRWRFTAYERAVEEAIA